MVDRVLRMEVHNVEHAVRGEHVVLLITGKAGGRLVRAEIKLTSWDTTYVASAMRAGVDKQVAEWQRAKDALR